MTEGSNQEPGPDNVGPEQYYGEDEPGPEANRGVPDEEGAEQSAGDTSTKIPVKYEDTIKGPAGDDDPLTQEYRRENWIPDTEKDKARAMADAEDENTTIAAIGDHAARTLSDLPNEVHRLRQSSGEHLPLPAAMERWTKKGKRQRELTQDAGDALAKTLGTGLTHSGGSVVNALDSLHDQGAKELHEEFVGRLSEEAHRHRARAGQIGELAAIIYDHPPSEAFQSSNSQEHDFADPKDLYFLEHGGVDEERLLAEEARADFEKLKEKGLSTLRHAQSSIDAAFDYFRIDAMDESLAEFQSEVRPLVRETIRLIETAYDDDMTVHQIKQRAIEIASNKALILEGQVLGLRRALRDVKSGKAADPEYRGPEIPTEQIAAALHRSVGDNRVQAEKWSELAKVRTGKEREEALAIANLHARRANEHFDELNQPAEASPSEAQSDFDPEAFQAEQANIWSN